MSSLNKTEKHIHISNIDEFLATCFLRNCDKAIKLTLVRQDEQDYIYASLKENDEFIIGDAVDFELSPGEYFDLSNIEIEELIKKPMITSYAYELFDFLLMSYSRLECLVEFSENAWKIRVLKAE